VIGGDVIMGRITNQGGNPGRPATPWRVSRDCFVHENDIIPIF
jgi:hypothetical protein